MPLHISVVIPVYNAAKFIADAVASALQFEEVKEVILVDDAGPDNSLEVCEQLAAREPRVKLFRHPGGVNKGAGESRNLGMRMAKEDHIAFLDADDQFLPERFDAERVVFKEHPDADGVYGAVAPHFHDPESKERFESSYRNALTTVHHRVPPEELFAGLIGAKGAGFGHFSLIALTIKRAALERMDGLMRSELKLHQDTEFMIRLAWYARLYPGSLVRPVSMRGVHPENRYVHQRSDNTQFLLYKVFYEWAEKVGVEDDAKERFHFKYRLFGVAAAPSKVAALRIAMSNPKYMYSYYFRDALFIRLAGDGTLLHNLFHKITWKIYPTPAAAPS